MITGHVINSSSCRNYLTSSVPHPSTILRGTMLNFRDRSLRIISTVLERHLWTDKGTEFYNQQLKRVLTANNVTLYSTENEEKSVDIAKDHTCTQASKL